MQLKLQIDVPLGPNSVALLLNAQLRLDIDGAAEVISRACSESYDIYKGGHHVAIHEKSAGPEYGQRVAMITEVN